MAELRQPIMRYFRSQRLRLLYQHFDIQAHTNVLDLGGGPFFWQLAEKLGLPLPKITIVNLRPAQGSLPPYITWIEGDATRLQFRDGEFDLVFCNSLIEHLGDWQSQELAAAEIRRVGKRYFVQTPLKTFPIEPHFVAPFVHWLPKSAQRKVVRNATLWGLIARPTPEECDRQVAELRLLSKSEMGTLFPNTKLIIERWMGCPKSVIALS